MGLCQDMALTEALKCQTQTVHTCRKYATDDQLLVGNEKGRLSLPLPHFNFLKTSGQPFHGNEYHLLLSKPEPTKSMKFHKQFCKGKADLNMIDGLQKLLTVLFQNIIITHPRARLSNQEGANFFSAEIRVEYLIQKGKAANRASQARCLCPSEKTSIHCQLPIMQGH